uniref:Alginate lyase n=6 Tax=Gammaproteobacteria TaxID=1236 RepID=Q51415_PSEAI|nr:alginate lyase [Pseudomonas aeruginosa]
MTSPFKVVAVSGGTYRPSRTLVLTQALIAELGQSLPIDSRVIELTDIAAPLGATLARNQAPAELQAVLDEIESADLLLVASPVYRGSYPGLLKHLFDLIDLNALIDTPVLLAATGNTSATRGPRPPVAPAVQLLPGDHPAHRGLRQRGRLRQLPDRQRAAEGAHPPRRRARRAAVRRTLRTVEDRLRCADERVLVPPDPRRWPLPRHQPGRAAGLAVLPEAGGTGGRQPWLSRRTDPHPTLLRRLLGGGLGLAPLTERLRFLVAIRPGIVSPTVSARMTATLDPVRWAPADQRGHRRRSRREPRRRHPFSATPSATRSPTSSSGLAARPAGRGGGLPRQAHPRGERQGALSAAATAVSAAVLRRFLGGRPRTGRRTGGRLPDLGRAVGGGGGENRRRAPASGSPWAYGEVRHPPACDRPRNRRRSLARRGQADRTHLRRNHRRRAAVLRPFRSGRPATHGRAARRPPRSPGDPAEPLGRGRPGARRRRHRAGRRSAAGGGAHRRIRRARHRQLHLLRLSAPGRGLPLRRTGLPAAVRTLRQPGRSWDDQPDRVVRRNDRQRRAAGSRRRLSSRAPEEKPPVNAKTRPEAQTPLQIVRRLAADFAENAAERDVAGGTPKAERDALRRSGLLSLIIPREYGGLGASWSETLQTVRELARVDSSIAHVYGFQHLMLATVRLFSRPEQ